LKGLAKLSILLDYKHSGMLWLSLQPHYEVSKLEFKSGFSMSKIIQIFLIFSVMNKNLGAHFFLKRIFGSFNFKTTFLLKSGSRLSKAT
jgi:hypothetical protein